MIRNQRTTVFVLIQGLENHWFGVFVEDVVDDDVIGRGTPAVESALVVSHGRIFAGLLHHLLQRVENLAVDVGVEVACKEDGSSLVQDYLLDTLRDELN